MPSSSPASARPVLDPQIAASDGAPTVLSKSVPVAAVRPDEGFAGTLRGRKLGHYELIEPIGVGGMAAVIRARDAHLDRTVALKILPPEMAADPEVVMRFQQEARAAARLDHENIARVYDCGEDQGLHYIAFEFVEGENLRAALERRGRLPVGEAVCCMLQIATGLTHAAARGVVHRDIKPSNIIIGPRGRAKLVDMGLARSLGHGDLALTQPGTTLGTFDYISPEQALDPRQADCRSDIYSLGCTFYHMLTGQAPVPEGTAAKKLHHHQQVAPVDPRQLNSEVPDEVAATLARMMAKNPAERYQQPVELVQHLLYLARKLGPADLPEGMFFVDAQPPRPARLRPVLIALAAAGVLAALVLWHAMTRPPGRFPLIRGTAAADSRADVADNLGSRDDPGPAGLARVTYEAGTAKELAEQLAKKDPVVNVYLTHDLDLTAEEMQDGSGRLPGLLFAGRDADGKDRELTIQPKGRQPVTIRLRYSRELAEEGIWTAFTVRGGRVTLRNLRFELTASRADEIKVAALRLQESGLLTLEDCQFTQSAASIPAPAGSALEQGYVTSVMVEGVRGSSARPVLKLSGCYFPGGQDAVAVSGSADINAWNCAFGPHAALFHFGDRTGETDLQLINCSALLAGGSAFYLEDNVSCRLAVSHCLFSQPATEGAADAVLIRQVSPWWANVQYTGRENRYQGLHAFWQNIGSDEVASVAANLEQFRKHAADDLSLELTASPWKERDPLALLKKGEPRLAFQLDVRQPELRQTIRGRERLVGVQRSVWGAAYDPRLPPLPPRETVAGIIVDPNSDPAAAKSGPGRVYQKLASAIAEAHAGDTIYIRHNGPLAVQPQHLEDPEIGLTIRPYAGFHPVLTLDKVSELDAPLFRLNDGSLRLEDLEFLLKPAKAGFFSQSVVTVAGSGQCTFLRCAVTLDASVNPTEQPLAVVALADPRQVMKMDTTSPPTPEKTPRLDFDTCFVRGQGVLVAVRASRPLALHAVNSLVALAGTLLSVDGNPTKDPADNGITVKLDKLTAYLTDHLVVLRTMKDMKDLVRIDVQQDNCLITSATRKSLVRLEGPVSTDQSTKERLNWSGQHNAYSNFKTMLDQQPVSPAVPPMNDQKWGQAFEKDPRWIDKAQFSVPAADVARSGPGDFKLPTAQSDLQGYGADVSELPRPAESHLGVPTAQQGAASGPVAPR